MNFKESLDDFKHILKSCYFLVTRLIRKYIISNKLLLVSLLIIIAVGAAGYAFGSTFTSSETKFLTRFHKLINSSDVSRALKFFVLENNSIQVSEENMEPFFKYIRQTANRSKSFIDALGKEPTKNAIAVLRKQKTIIGTSFMVELKPVYIDITTTYKGTEIYLEDTLLATSDKDNFTMTAGPLIPGLYHIKGFYKNQYGESTVEQTVSALIGTSSVVLPLESRRISLESNYEDAYVYLNGERTDKQVKDFKNIGPFPGNDDIKLYIEKNFPWGTIKSTEIEVNTSSRVRLDINPLTPELKSQLDATFKLFFQSLFNALSSEKIDLIRNADDSVKKTMFSNLLKDSFIVKNSYSLKDIEYEQNVISVLPKDTSFTASANVTVEYKTSKKILGINLPNSYTTMTQKYKTTLTYDKAINQWLVSDIQEL